MARRMKFVEAVGVSNVGGRKGTGKKKALKWIRINFVELFMFGDLYVTASTILKDLLETYNVKYELLANESPGVVDYHIDDEEFIYAMEGARRFVYPLEAMRKVIMEYAVKRGAGAVVELFDGYEYAWALVFEEG